MRAALYTSAIGLDVASTVVVDRFVQLRELAAARGWSVVAELADVSRSRVGKKTGFAELQRLVAAGKVDVVVSESLARLFREVSRAARFLPEWSARGVRVVCLGGRVDGSTEHGWLRLLDVVDVLRDWAEDLAVERLQRLAARAAERGPRPPRLAGKPLIAINPHEVRMAHERGLSLREGVRWIRRRGGEIGIHGYGHVLRALKEAGGLDEAKRAEAIAARGGLPKGGRPRGSRNKVHKRKPRAKRRRRSGA